MGWDRLIKGIPEINKELFVLNVEAEIVEIRIDNIIRIINETKVKKFVLDYHFLRDLKWNERIKKAHEATKKKKVKVITFADFLGDENDLLEARRK